MSENNRIQISENNFEEILVSGKEDELNQLKAWLFKENIRIETERIELKRMSEKFQKEREQFRDEMTELNQRIVTERKRLKQDEMFFDKKMDILKNGFIQLDAERKEFERNKIKFEAAKEQGSDSGSSVTVQMLFKGTNSILALKKRYRELLKLYHPDNMSGDTEMVMLINKAYEEKKKEYEVGRFA